MQQTLASTEQALALVKQILNALTSRGDHAAAYEVARAQYRASIRDSWPNNLGVLLRALQEVHDNPKLQLTDEERGGVAEAIRLLRSAFEQ
ncbi:MAG: hypothetical protein MUF54_08175 [Polyangiaceae bacterium]|jgi:hypothetical protein|nr:hypothetical protein [Polyangiaceae bacterium]